MASRFQPARLDEEALSEVKSLEDELGKLVVAVEPDSPVADLSSEQIDRIKDAEKRLGVLIVAYETA